MSARPAKEHTRWDEGAARGYRPLSVLRNRPYSGGIGAGMKNPAMRHEHLGWTTWALPHSMDCPGMIYTPPVKDFAQPQDTERDSLQA